MILTPFAILPILLMHPSQTVQPLAGKAPAQSASTVTPTPTQYRDITIQLNSLRYEKATPDDVGITKTGDEPYVICFTFDYRYSKGPSGTYLAPHILRIRQALPIQHRNIVNPKAGTFTINNWATAGSQFPLTVLTKFKAAIDSTITVGGIVMALLDEDGSGVDQVKKIGDYIRKSLETNLHKALRQPGTTPSAIHRQAQDVLRALVNLDVFDVMVKGGDVSHREAVDDYGGLRAAAFISGPSSPQSQNASDVFGLIETQDQRFDFPQISFYFPSVKPVPAPGTLPFTMRYPGYGTERAFLTPNYTEKFPYLYQGACRFDAAMFRNR